MCTRDLTANGRVFFERRTFMAERAPLIALTDDGRLFVKLDTLMDPMVAMCDGLSLTFFGRGKTAYLNVDDAIAWCEKELKGKDRAMQGNAAGFLAYVYLKE
jgi:hypothetical protein